MASLQTAQTHPARLHHPNIDAPKPATPSASSAIPSLEQILAKQNELIDQDQEIVSRPRAPSLDRGRHTRESTMKDDAETHHIHGDKVGMEAPLRSEIVRATERDGNLDRLTRNGAPDRRYKGQRDLPEEAVKNPYYTHAAVGGIVGDTHVTRDGAPDRRFKKNRALSEEEARIERFKLEAHQLGIKIPGL